MDNVEAKNAQSAEQQIAELQARGSALENERRMWKARFTALRTIYEILMIELPVAVFMNRDGSGFAQRAFLEVSARIDNVAARADQLEADAWTQLAPVVRAFNAASRGMSEGADAAELRAFIDRWRDTFLRALA